MKRLTLTTILFAFVIFTGYSQDSISTKQIKNKPKAIYRVGSSKVVVWENKQEDGTSWKNYKVEKEYIKDGVRKSTNSFNDNELIELKLAIDKAINEENLKVGK